MDGGESSLLGRFTAPHGLIWQYPSRTHHEKNGPILAMTPSMVERCHLFPKNQFSIILELIWSHLIGLNRETIWLRFKQICAYEDLRRFWEALKFK